MKIQQVLTELGLTEAEAAIYIQLAKTAGVQPASIIATRLKMNRTTVYKSLVKLTKMGLVTKTMKHGTICFIVEEPDKHLENLLLKKKARLAFVSDLFVDAIPELKNLRKEELLTPKVRYYEGFEGLKRVYEDTLIENQTIYAFEDVGEIAFEVLDYLTNDYVPRRTEKGIFAHVITPKSPDNEDYRSRDKKCARETKFITGKIFPFAIEINIYGNKTAFFSYRHDEMFGVIIESAAIATAMKAVFNICWKIAK